MQRLKPVAPTHNLRAITIVQAVDRTREERTRCQPLFRSIRTRLAPIEGGGRGGGGGERFDLRKGIASNFGRAGNSITDPSL